MQKTAITIIASALPRINRPVNSIVLINVNDGVKINDMTHINEIVAHFIFTETSSWWDWSRNQCSKCCAHTWRFNHPPNYEDGWELFHTLDVSFSGGIFLSLWKNQPFNILTWNFLQLLDKGLFSVWYILDFWIRPPEMRKSKI